MYSAERGSGAGASVSFSVLHTATSEYGNQKNSKWRLPFTSSSSLLHSSSIGSRKFFSDSL